MKFVVFVSVESASQQRNANGMLGLSTTRYLQAETHEQAAQLGGQLVLDEVKAAGFWSDPELVEIETGRLGWLQRLKLRDTHRRGFTFYSEK